MKIGFIGVGNMGEAILRGALRGGVVPPAEIAAFDTNTDKVGALQAELGINSADSIAQLVTKSDLVLLAVKPHVCPGVLAEIKDLLKGKALISIAAGWSQARLAASLLPSVRILRVMPNTPALVMLLARDVLFSTESFSFAGLAARVPCPLAIISLKAAPITAGRTLLKSALPPLAFFIRSFKVRRLPLRPTP